MTPQQLLANMQKIAAKMDADMRTVMQFMQMTKAKFEEIDRRLAAIENGLQQRSMNGVTPQATPSAPIATPSKATITIRRADPFYGPSEDAVFSSGGDDDGGT